MQNIGYKLSLAAFALVLVSAGCGSTSSSTEVSVNTDGSSVSSGSGSCSPLKVTVDGVDVSAQYSNALSYTGVNMGYRTEIVSLYNGEKFNYTCDDVVGSGRIDSNDLDMVGASYNDISYAQGVNFGSDNYATPTKLRPQLQRSAQRDHLRKRSYLDRYDRTYWENKLPFQERFQEHIVETKSSKRCTVFFR